MPDILSVSAGREQRTYTISRLLWSGNALCKQQGTGLRDIRDGTASTLLAIEVGPDKAEPWIKPGGIPINSPNLLAELGSPREKGYLALFADGSVVTLRKDNPRRRYVR